MGRLAAGIGVFALAALILLPGHQATPAKAAGEGVFSLDATSYQTVEGQAVLVKVTRTGGALLTTAVDVQLKLTPGAHAGSGTGFDWPPSDETKLVTFPAGSNLTSQQVFIQTLNQNHYQDRTINVSILSVTNGGQIGAVWTAPITLRGTNAPRITSVSPRSAGTDTVAATTYPVIIRGLNFQVPGSTFETLRFRPVAGGIDVPINPAAASVAFNPADPTTITLDLNDCGAMLNNGSEYFIIVVVKDGAAVEFTSSPEPASRFTFTCGPTVTAISPQSGPVTGGTLVRITGTGFDGPPGTACTDNGITAYFAAIAATECTVVAPGIIDAKTPAHGPGKGNVQVAVVGMTPSFSPPTAENEFTFDQGPQVTGLAPAFGPMTGGNTVVITGSNFLFTTPGVAVLFGGNPAASFLVESDTRITAVAPAGAGVQQVTVSHPLSGSSPFNSAANYTYTSGPLVTAIEPASGPVVGGTVVRIFGSAFQPGATVTFGAVAATFVTVKSEAEIEAISPPGTNVQFIRVTVNGVVSPDVPQAQFAYSGPTVESVNPIAGPVTGGATVTIKGKNFNSGASVQFGTINVVPAYIDTQTLTAIVPPSPNPQAVHIRVTTGSGQSPVNDSVQYTYTNGPIVDAINPASGPTTGASIVVVTGKNFLAPLTVSIGGVNVESFNVNSATQITLLTPSSAAAGPVDIRVTKGADISPVGHGSRSSRMSRRRRRSRRSRRTRGPPSAATKSSSRGSA